MTPSPPLTASAAVESIKRSLSVLCAAEDQRQFPSSYENPREFCGYARRLQLVLNQFLCSSSSPDDFPAALQTALKGIACDLARALETVSMYWSRSKIFVLINCLDLSTSLQESTVAIGQWLALICFPQENSNLLNKISDLSREMKQAQFRVTQNEERVHCTLEKEGQGRQTTKAVQSAVIMDLSRALGVEPDNHAELSNQIKLLARDVCNSHKVSERRLLASLEKIMNSWSVEPNIVSGRLDFDHGDEAHMLPFTNFICPLTKEVMKDPVDLETSQTYERTAIEYWFKRCIDDIRDPTCPVTGTVLKSLDLKTNIGLAGAIEEWVNRNVEIQMKFAVKVLTDKNCLLKDVERVLDIIYRISEEHPVSRHKIRQAQIVPSIVALLKNSSKDIKSPLRSKALMVLASMAKDEESKKTMLDEGVTRLAIHGLIGSSEKEREYAVKWLLEFANDEASCRKIASEKGALVLLCSMAGNRDHPSLSNLAEEVLCRLEGVKENIQQLAAAGRFEPLLRRLHQGTDDERVEMITMVGGMTLTNNSKEQIARQCGKGLVDFLNKSRARSPSLKALHNLSDFEDNSTILIDAGVLPALAEVLFDSNNTISLKVMQDKELAAAVVANLVSNPGHWELASANKDGDKMQSESVVHSYLRLISIVSSQCQASILHILCGILSSPQASDSVASGVNSGEGIKVIIPFLEHPGVEHRIYAFKITRVLSERFGQNLVSELRLCNKLSVFKEKLLDEKSTDGERSDAASILSNLSFSEDEVKVIFDPSFMKWAANTLKNLCRSSNGNILRPTSNLLEGLLGLLLPFMRSLDPSTLAVVREHRLMAIFNEQLGLASKPSLKQLLVLGLRNLSECGRSLAAGDPEPAPPIGFCSPLILLCGAGSSKPNTCPIHNIPCDADSQLCLLKSNCIRPLVELLKDNDTTVRIASLEALSTLFSDTSTISKRAMDELEQLRVVDAVISLFIESRPGEIQERAAWMTEKILRVESSTHQHSLDQSLVRALVEAFKHGSPNTKRFAQDALTNLKQLSVVSGMPSSGFR